MLRISVPAELQRQLHRELLKAGDRECGGILMGEHVGVNHFAVRSISVQKPGAVASFVRQLTGTVAAIREFCRVNGDNFTRFNYLGEWHTHPLFSVQPSAQDHATMRELAQDKKVGANFVVLLVLRLNRGLLDGSAHTYLPDGSVHQSELELEKCS